MDNIWVIVTRNMVRFPPDVDVQAIADEHGGDLTGHLPDSAQFEDVVVSTIRPATEEEIAEARTRNQ